MWPKQGQCFQVLFVFFFQEDRYSDGNFLQSVSVLGGFYLKYDILSIILRITYANLYYSTTDGQ